MPSQGARARFENLQLHFHAMTGGGREEEFGGGFSLVGGILEVVE